MIMSGMKHFLHNNEGTTAVEFALVATAFLSIVFGIFESGRLFLAWNAFQYSLENATRYALVNEDTTEDDLEEMIASDMAALMVDQDDIAVEIAYEDLSGVSFIEIDGTYTFRTVMPLLPTSWTNFALTANSRLPVIQQ